MRSKGALVGDAVAALGVLALLAVVLFPTVSAIHTRGEQADEAQCVSNLKGQALAYLMYSEEWNQHTTPAYTQDKRGWYNRLEPYVRDSSVFDCPSYVTRLTYAGAGYPQGYGMNELLCQGIDLDAVAQPADLIIIGDDAEDNPGKGTRPAMGWDTKVSTNHAPPADRHDGGANMAFADGHVQWFKYQDLGYRDQMRHPDPPGKDYWRPKTVAATP